jgi:hypothetical protein
MSAETVHVISSGSYSDYRVHAVVKGSKADAERLAERANGIKDTYHDDYEIETLPVVTPDVERVSILHIQEQIWDDGTTTDRHEQTSVEWPFDTLYDLSEMTWRWVRAPMHKNRGGRLEVRGTDHERVRKVFSDRRAALMVDDALRAVRERQGRN